MRKTAAISLCNFRREKNKQRPAAKRADRKSKLMSIVIEKKKYIYNKVEKDWLFRFWTVFCFSLSTNGVRRRNNRKMAYPVTLPCYFWGEEIASWGFLFWNKTNLNQEGCIFININMVCTYCTISSILVCLATRHHSVILVSVHLSYFPVCLSLKQTKCVCPLFSFFDEKEENGYSRNNNKIPTK